MTPERWRQVEELYNAALERTPAERTLLLSRADPELRGEAESLLNQASGAGPLDRPAWGQSAGDPDGSLSSAVYNHKHSAMSLSPGTRLGPHEIVAPLGAGGMGEVYKARDTRLDRTVAIKVLSARQLDTTDARDRFEREARAVSGLNHPHICTLYDIGHQDGLDYLVMEYLEGETLEARLAKGPLPLDQALSYAIQIAGALDRAHRQGVVHRDLKPGNIMLTKAGAKLLDFGLAKIHHSALGGAPSALTSKPTEALTTPGMIMGTIQYMSPEQLEGKEADARTDLFAFGAVLYEMVTGRKAFEGKSQASVMVAILERDVPPPSSLQPASPPALDRLIAQCLVKDRDERRQSAHDLMLELKSIASGGSQPGLPAAPEKPKIRHRIAWIAAALLLATTLTLAFAYYRRVSATPRLLRFSIAPPEQTTIEFTSPVSTSLPALSPDGRQLSFVASGEGKSQLWLRALDSLAARPLPGSEGANNPFWSPDSRYIAFFADGKLKKLDVTGGSALTLCDAPMGRGGSWSQSEIIIFAPALASGLFRVPAAGGSPTPLTTLDQAQGESSHRFPWFLPDGHHFLYTARHPVLNKTVIYVGDLQSKERKLVATAASNAVYAPPGFILFLRDGNLMAQPFNASSARATGDPVPIAERVDYLSSNAQAQFTVSQTGVLAYISSNNAQDPRLTWFDRAGKETGAIGRGYAPAISPDGKTIAFGRRDRQTGFQDIWLHDAERDTDSRLTSGPRSSTFPVWAPDGDHIAFASDRGGVGSIYQTATNGTGGVEPLADQSPFSRSPTDWSRDGRFLIFDQVGPKTSNGIWALPLAGDRKPFPVLQADFNGLVGRLSPDGRWLAYVSTENKQYEVYVASFSGSPSQSPGKWQISTSGGIFPVWRRDGKELFYIADRTLMAVEIIAGSGFRHGEPKPLFAVHTGGDLSYDVSPDGKHFLIPSQLDTGASAPIVVVDNWAAALKK